MKTGKLYKGIYLNRVDVNLFYTLASALALFRFSFLSRFLCLVLHSQLLDSLERGKPLTSIIICLLHLLEPISSHPLQY
jgi:hypothetical protein